jgi:hypothetical protein
MSGEVEGAGSILGSDGVMEATLSGVEEEEGTGTVTEVRGLGLGLGVVVAMRGSAALRLIPPGTIKGFCV